MKRFGKRSRQQVMDALCEMNGSSLFQVDDRYIPDDEVPELFAKAWVTALPYRGCSQSSLVGLSHNFSRPVVASRVGAIAEIVDDGVTGAVVDPESDEAFAGAIVNLLADKSKCLSMGKAGFDRINKERSWDIVADETLKAYHRVLQAKA
jgi:glycosyltransferase involved in cell wall biosynthesis